MDEKKVSWKIWRGLYLRRESIPQQLQAWIASHRCTEQCHSRCDKVPAACEVFRASWSLYGRVLRWLIWLFCIGTAVALEY